MIATNLSSMVINLREIQEIAISEIVNIHHHTTGRLSAFHLLAVNERTWPPASMAGNSRGSSQLPEVLLSARAIL